MKCFFCADQNETTSCNIHKPGSQAPMTLESPGLVCKKQKHEQNICNSLRILTVERIW